MPAEPAAPAPKGKGKAKAPEVPAPARASLFKDMDPATVTLEEVLPLLTLPRTLGSDPEKNEPITAQNGRYGPYVKRGTESRSLATESQLLTVTLEEALALLATPKLRGRAAAAPPLRELGEDAVSKKPMVIKEGRFGLTSPTARPTQACARATRSRRSPSERASELLADRRARGPAPAKARKAAKKAPAKKAAKTRATKS